MNFFYLTLELLTSLAIIFSIAVITSTNPVIAIIYLISLFSTVAIYLILIGFNFIGISYLIIYIGAITVLFLFIIMMISTEIMKTVEIGKNFTKLLPLAYTLALLFLLLLMIIFPLFLDINSLFSLEIFKFFEKFIFSFSSIFQFFIDKENFLNFNILNNTLNSILKLSYFDIVEAQFNSNTLIFLVKPEILFHQNLQIQILGESIYGSYAIILILSSFLLLLAMVCPIILSKKN